MDPEKIQLCLNEIDLKLITLTAKFDAHLDIHRWKSNFITVLTAVLSFFFGYFLDFFK